MKTTKQASFLSATYNAELNRKGLPDQLSSKLLLAVFAQIKNGPVNIYLLRDLLRTILMPRTYFSFQNTARPEEMKQFRTALIPYHTQLRKRAYHIIFKNNLRPPGFDALSGIGRRWLFSQRFG